MILAMIVALGLVLLPPVSFDGDLPEILERGKSASYSAEQVTTCATPDGFRGTLVTIRQAGADLLIGSDMSGGTSVAIGPGGWALMHQDGVVDQARVTSGNVTQTTPYTVVHLGGLAFLGREATAYHLERDGVVRAEILLDDTTGVPVRAITYEASGATYCVHRFISFSPGSPELPARPTDEGSPMTPVATPDTTGFPAEVAGFSMLDQYEDTEGLRFTYYSDGFFSFAVFQTPAVVPLPDASAYRLGEGEYQRVFTPGQVFYSWETRDGGMAMVGDLPPDLQDAVLTALPQPDRPGLFRRLWRSLFG